MIDRPPIQQELLQFRPRWWWDPVPPWLFEHLDRKIAVQLAQVQLEVQEAIMKQQVKALTKTREILRQMG